MILIPRPSTSRSESWSLWLSPSLRIFSLFSLFSVFISSTYVHAVLVNRTIDDALPDAFGNKVQYFPNGTNGHAWNVGGECDSCTASGLDVSQLFDKTWHDGTTLVLPVQFNPQPGSNDFPNVPLNASVTFNGTAIYVFCILALTSSSPTGDSDMSFYIDNQLSGTFVQKAPGVPEYDYHVPVYVNTSLSPGPHTLLLQNGHVNGTKSLVLLDEIVYSVDDGTPEISPSTLTSSDAQQTAPKPSFSSPSDTANNKNSAIGTSITSLYLTDLLVSLCPGLFAFGLLFI
ncbi:hypothetical protein D9758_007971 [Tetrapyrgos nigripes]|uniref:Uncharacterized protein n=1 Tax=Tetrapyrgos nigripes TaxID=182062 RepID=A0A8H5FWI8_9AGAR|nr:hypothetical protein D9758_007971 [Tetrapyrgos nigripes]